MNQKREIQELRKQVDELKRRVADLEARLVYPVPPPEPSPAWPYRPWWESPFHCTVEAAEAVELPKNSTWLTVGVDYAVGPDRTGFVFVDENGDISA